MCYCVKLALGTPPLQVGSLRAFELFFPLPQKKRLTDNITEIETKYSFFFRVESNKLRSDIFVEKLAENPKLSVQWHTWTIYLKIFETFSSPSSLETQTTFRNFGTHLPAVLSRKKIIKF